MNRPDINLCSQCGDYLSTDHLCRTGMSPKLRQRMARHITALVFEQIDNNGEWMMHQEYTEGLVDAALESWRDVLKETPCSS